MNKTSFVLLLLVLTLLPSCKGRSRLLPTRSVPAAPVVVKVQQAAASDGRGSVGYVGTVVSRQTANLVAPAAGTLVSLPVREGMRVEKGRVLARIESQSVTSACEAAASRLSQAEDAWKRIQIVRQSGTVTEVEYVKVKTDKVYLTQGVETLPAEQILRLVDLRSPEVHFPLPESEFSSHAVGEILHLYFPALDTTSTGTLSVKGITASPISHSYTCVVSLKERIPGLAPGMVCKLYLPEGETPQIVIPTSAVMTDMDGRYVWTATDGIVAKRRVTVSGYSGSGIIISDGLEATDLVIVEGGRKVSTGMQVETQF